MRSSIEFSAKLKQTSSALPLSYCSSKYIAPHPGIASTTQHFNSPCPASIACSTPHPTPASPQPLSTSTPLALSRSIGLALLLRSVASWLPVHILSRQPSVCVLRIRRSVPLQTIQKCTLATSCPVSRFKVSRVAINVVVPFRSIVSRCTV